MESKIKPINAAPIKQAARINITEKISVTNTPKNTNPFYKDVNLI
jgi:hypothetical protein